MIYHSIKCYGTSVLDVERSFLLRSLFLLITFDGVHLGDFDKKLPLRIVIKSSTIRLKYYLIIDSFNKMSTGHSALSIN